MKRLAIPLALIFGFLLISSASSEEPTSQPSVIDATDMAALTAAKGQEVVVKGEIESADWSRSGKVMNITFKGSELLGAAFEKNRQKLDEAYNGDLAKTLTGAKVRIRAKVQEYGGRVEALKGKLQLIITTPNQITLEEAPTTNPG